MTCDTDNWGNRNRKNQSGSKYDQRRRTKARHMSGGKSHHPRRAKHK